MASKFKSCSVENCNGNAHGSERGCKGFCSTHYQRYKRHGDPLAGRTLDGEPLRFIHEGAAPFKGSDCLTWPYGYRRGYGQVMIDGKNVQAHRYICKLVHGAPPRMEHEAAHNCGNRACVNPNHLAWKTRVENAADKLVHDTHIRGERHVLAKLTNEQALSIIQTKGIKSQSEIASEFGVSQSNVSKNAWREKVGVALS